MGVSSTPITSWSQFQRNPSEDPDLPKNPKVHGETLTPMGMSKVYR